MSKTAQVVLWVVVAVVVVGGIWWWVASQNGNGVPSQAYGTPTSTTATPPTSAPSVNATSTTEASGTSDQSINEDMTNINAQMNGMSSDSASMNQSLNDQPVQQQQL